MTVLIERKLAFQEGTSDKVYVARVVLLAPNVWVVSVEYGRRGAHMTSGEKYRGASKDDAVRVFEKTVKEKIAKGYKDEAPAYAAPPSASPVAMAPVMAVPSLAQLAPPVMKAEGMGSAADGRAIAHRCQDEAGAWWAEVKLDGMRCRVIVVDGRVEAMLPRDSLDSCASRFPELLPHVVEALPPEGTFVLDGEVGYLDVTGLKMDVSVLQARARADSRKIRLQAQASPMHFVVFDVLRSSPHGGAIFRRPLVERRGILAGLVKPREGSLVRVIEVELEDFVGLFDRVVHLGGEGIVLKRRASAYQPGVRSKDWIKAKAPSFLDSLAVVGITQGEGARSTTFGALVCAQRTERGWEYVCQAGSGLSDEDQVRVMDATAALRATKCPLVATPRLKRPILMWLRPENGIRADVRYTAPTKLSPRFPTVASVSVPADE